MEQQRWEYKEINTILGEVARRRPNKVYIESPDQQKNITFDQTYMWCNRVANLLKKQGIKSSDKIALIGENSIETLLIYLGVLNYGAIISPINAEESEENVYRLLSIIKPRIVFYSEELTFKPEGCGTELQMSYSNFDADRGQENKLFSILKNYAPVFESPVGSKEDIAELIFTSGTTATPKAVVITRESIFYMVLGGIDRLKIGEGDVILDYRAYSWESPQIMSILPTLMVGATLVFARKFSRTRFPSWLKGYPITICVGVPTVLNFLLEEPIPLHKTDVPFLRFMTSSTAPLIVESLLEFEKRYGILIDQGAGGTECGVIGMNDPEDLKHPERRKIGSIGKPFRYKEVLILDDDGNRCRAGAVGEIVVRGKGTALGYLQPDGTVDRFPETGIRTGDLGYIDSDGYIYIVGRKKDLIIRGGVNIAPMEITACLMEHPAVKEAATIGVPDGARGEEIASFVVPKAGYKIDQATIINHCRKKLPDFKLPKTVCFIDQIPKTERQKVAKTYLLRIWEEQRKKTAVVKKQEKNK